MLTLQQIYNQVCAHLASQQECCIDSETGKCVFRTKSANRVMLKCAIGGIIPEDCLDLIEGAGKNTATLYAIDSLIHPWMQGELAYRSRPERERYAIIELQSIHDLDHVSDWPERYTAIAKEYNLTPYVWPKDFPSAPSPDR
jgi:hypothetical protein